MIRTSCAARDVFASLLRTIPSRVRGRGRAAKFLLNSFGPGSSDQDALRWVQLWDGSRMLLDLRSQTEQMAYFLGEYDRQLIQWVCSRLPEDATIVDAGANVGFWALSMASQLRSSVIVAVEAMPSNAERLSRNVEVNGGGGEIRVKHVALGDREGELVLQLQGDATTGNAFVVKQDHEDAEGKSYFRIPTTTLDDLYAEEGLERCQFIKVDIEGYEVPFLRGAIATLRRERPVILGEFNNYFMNYHGYSFEDVNELLNPLGYSAFIMSQQGPLPFKGNKKDTENVLLIPEGRESSHWLES